METDPECLLIAYYCEEVAIWVEGSCGITDEPEPSSRSRHKTYKAYKARKASKASPTKDQRKHAV